MATRKNHKYICYYCKEKVEPKDLIEWEVGTQGNKNRGHKKCREEFLKRQNDKEQNRLNAVKEKKKLKEQKKLERKQKQELIEKRKQKDKEAWNNEFGELDKVYRYLQDILNFHKPLAPKTVMIIQNLRAGKIVKKGTEVWLSKNGYPYEVILLTMKAKRQDIDKALKYKLSNSEEENKVKYIMAIVANAIPDIYIRWERKNLQENKIDEVVKNELVDIESNKNKATYVPTEKKKDEDLDNLW